MSRLKWLVLGWKADRVGLRVRWWLFWTIAFSGLAAGSTWQYRTEVFQWLLAPADGKLSPFPGGLPVFTSPTDMWWLTIGLVIRFGLVAALPMGALGTYVIARPIIHPRLRRFLLLFAISSVTLFSLGMAFVYYVMLPASMGFLLGFGTDVAVPLIGIRQYFELLFALMVWVGLVFELPLAMWMATKMKLVKYQQFKKFRKFVPFAALILGAIITPTADPVNQALVAVPIVLLYEVGLFMSWAARRSEGNYFWMRSIGNAIRYAYRKVKAVVLAPVTVPRWLMRKVLRR